MASNDSVDSRVINSDDLDADKALNFDVVFHTLFSIVIIVAILYLITMLSNMTLRKNPRHFWPITTAIFILLYEALLLTEQFTWAYRLPSWNTVHALTCVFEPVRLASDAIILIMMISIVAERVHARCHPDYIGLTNRAALITIVVTVVVLLLWEFICVHVIDGGLSPVEFRYRKHEGSDEFNSITTYLLSNPGVVRWVHGLVEDVGLHFVLIVITCIAVHQCRKSDEPLEHRYIVIASGVFCIMQTVNAVMSAFTTARALRIISHLAYAVVLTIWLACEPRASLAFRSLFCRCLRKNDGDELEAELLTT